jgi:hypothetical protein
MNLFPLYAWYKDYRGAVLETDLPKQKERLLAAEHKIIARLRVLAQDHGGTPEEREAIVAALSGINALRSELSTRSVLSSSDRPE